MKKHERTHNLEAKLIASEASDDQARRQFKALAEELEAELFAERARVDLLLKNEPMLLDGTPIENRTDIDAVLRGEELED